MLVVSLLEGLYVMYMFIYFKTCYNLEVGRGYNGSLSKYIKKITSMDYSEILYHSKEKCRTEKSQICLFGKYGSVLIFFYLLLREFVSLPKYTNLIVFVIILGLCMLNYNAVLYMLPIISIEIYMNRNKLKNLFTKKI
jgi:hypothetical protein